MKKVILAVDDNPNGLVVLGFAVERIDPSIRVESVGSGGEALEFLRTCKPLPALVLLDMKMPGLDGIETLKIIRADETLKHLPVVITTLSILESDADVAYRAGASGFVRRSLSIEELSGDIKEYVQRWAGTSGKPER